MMAWLRRVIPRPKRPDTGAAVREFQVQAAASRREAARLRRMRGTFDDIVLPEPKRQNGGVQ